MKRAHKRVMKEDNHPMETKEVKQDSLNTAAFAIDATNGHEYSIQTIRWLLVPIGVWPLPLTASRARKLLSDVLFLICSSLMACMVIPCALSVFFELDDIQVILKSIGPINFWLMASVKYCFLIIHSDGIRGCLQHVETDWYNARTQEDREIMRKNAKIGRYMIYFCLVCMHTGVFLYGLVKGLSAIPEVIGNISSTTYHTVPYPFYNRIADPRYTPTYEIVFSIQCLSTFVVNSINVGACGLAAVLVMHACGQLQIIMSWLQNIANTNKESRRVLRKRLAVIVEHHLRVLCFISNIEDIMNQICFVELVVCTLIICLLGYYTIMEWQQNDTKSMIACVFIFISLTFSIFIICYIGEVLSEQCRQVGETAYMTDWYRLPKETCLGFILIISRSRSVIKISAGKLIELSLSTFGKVIRTAMAYFNILWTMME